ncbi:MAG: ABC transporter substrate-binding protein [Thermodesulfobacteriota bacterium]|nr:ABC transporter substrate-binding protein [Thermodesulfobacteriota bacterium]
MQIRKRPFVFILFTSLILIVGNGSLSYCDEMITGVTDKAVKIGIMADLTGPSADTWISFADGAKSYLNMVNDTGGVHGRKIKYIFEDDRYSIPLALSSFKKLVFKDKIFVLQGASGVGHTAAIIPLAEKKKIPLIAPIGDKKYFEPARKYIFCPIPWYQDQAKVMIEYIFNDMKLKNPTIALLWPDVASGKETRDTLRELVKVYPVQKYKEVVFPIGIMDFTSEILTLKRLKPDIVLIHADPPRASSILRSAYRLRFTTHFMVAQYGCVDKTIETSGKTAAGLLGVNCFGTWDDNSKGVNRLRKATLAYYPDIRHKDATIFQGWFMGFLFGEALKNAGMDLTRETFLKGMEAIRDYDTQGICGVISFGPDDHKSIETHKIYKADIKKNKFIPITGWRRPKAYDF